MPDKTTGDIKKENSLPWLHVVKFAAKEHRRATASATHISGPDAPGNLISSKFASVTRRAHPVA